MEKEGDPSVVYEYAQNEVTANSRRQYPLGLPILSRTYVFHWEEPHSAIINLIHVLPPCKPTTYIKDYFDLDFCKVSYDGVKIRIANLDSLFTKTATVNWDQYKALHTQWIQCPHPPYTDKLDNKVAADVWLWSRLKDRQEKYQKREFQVILDLGSHPPIEYQPRPDTCYSTAEF